MKINPTQLVGARGLRLGIYPKGNKSAVKTAPPAIVPQKTRKFVAWRLRLTNGAKAASEAELRGAEDWLESFETACGAAVFLGIAVEVLLAIIHPAYGSVLERWVTTIADAAVAGGVLGEVLASARGRVIQGELTLRSNKRLSLALDQAANAEAQGIEAQAEAQSALCAVANAQAELADAICRLSEAEARASENELAAAEARERTAEIERLTAWRKLSPEQKGQLKSLAKEFHVHIDLLVESHTGDPEAFAYGKEIASAFAAGGVTRIRSGANMFVGPVFSVLITSYKDEVRRRLIAVFLPKVTLCDTDLSKYLSDNKTAPSLYIFVSPKSPPDLAWKMATPEITVHPAASDEIK